MDTYDKQVINIWSCAEFMWLAISAEPFDDDVLYYGLICFPGGARELTHWSQWEIDRYNESCATPIRNADRAVFGTLAEEMVQCINQPKKRRGNAR